MPKFPRGFGRRKSTANALEHVEGAVAEPSFKVFEREDSNIKSFDGGSKLGQAITAPLIKPKTPVLSDDDTMFETIYNRGSAASNTNTISTTDNSSRLSAVSTAPSSTDISRREDWKSPHDKPFNDIPVPPVPKTAPTFSLKSAGRTLSWGRHSKATPPPPGSKVTPPDSPQTEEIKSSGRDRAVTASSYASTATPPKLEDKDLGLSMGGDFSDMFSGFSKRRSTVLDAETNRAITRSPESMPVGPAPASRSLIASRFKQPSPLSIDTQQVVEPSPYSWSTQHSHDNLMHDASLFSTIRNTPPPVPQHITLRANDNLPSQARPQRPTNGGLRRSSALMEPKRQSTFEYGDAVDEDARLLRESTGASRRMDDNGPDSRIRETWATPPTMSYKVDDTTLASWGTGSDTTPKAKKSMKRASEDNLFDVNIVASADLAQRFNERSSPPLTESVAAPQNKIMTPAQFERYKRDQEGLRSFGGISKDDEDEDDEPYEDDEDDAEKNKRLVKQRRKQEAHMSVYRQQMMKVTGEVLPPARPSVFATQSTPNLVTPEPADGSEEEDEEVPLAILQAHGFPSKGKQPMRSMGSNPNLRSAAGGVVSGTDGRLPVFARHLPQDPYVGAGLVNPMHRESLSFGGGSGSVIGEPPRGLPPGGLVGVIATEERSRAMRRGSPNHQGGFGASHGGGFNPMMGMQPPPGGGMYNGMGPAAMGLGMGMQPPASGMYSGMGQGPMGPMGPMPPMMLTPGDQAQIQMSQQMQQFMTMQMQFMQMMTSGGQAPPNPPNQMLQRGEIPRPGSAQQIRPRSVHLPGASHQRTMTMMDLNAPPWRSNGGSQNSPSQGAYAASIAPSERSNIGLPGRYRPVSQVLPQAQQHPKGPSGLSNTFNGWEDKDAATINAVKKTGNVSDDDEDEGWEEMKKKREKNKSLWRTKKGKEDTPVIPNYAL